MAQLTDNGVVAKSLNREAIGSSPADLEDGAGSKPILKPRRLPVVMSEHNLFDAPTPI